MIRGTVRPLLFKHRVNKWQIQGDSPSSPRRNSTGAHCRNLPGLEIPKGCHMPAIEMLGHRPGELGVGMETRKIGVIDCFPLRAHRYQTG